MFRHLMFRALLDTAVGAKEGKEALGAGKEGGRGGVTLWGGGGVTLWGGLGMQKRSVVLVIPSPCLQVHDTIALIQVVWYVYMAAPFEALSY